MEATGTLATGAVGERATESAAPRAGTSQANPGREPAGEDLQSLLGQAVERLATSTRSPRVAAWGRGPDGTPVVLAARIEGPALRSPSQDAYGAGIRLTRPQDLGAAGVAAALADVASSDGFGAVAPIHLSGDGIGGVGTGGSGIDGGGEGLALLLLGGPSDPPGRVRPRTLAALGAAAGRLAAPMAAAHAAERLAQVDQEVRRLDRLAALGSLVAEIVHEIRNPLVSVKTFLQLLPERESDPEFTESFLEVAREELQRIERLLNLVLQHGRPGGAERSEADADVATTLDSVLQLVRFRADDRGVTLQSEAEASLPRAGLSADALRQALLNLALNAIEASPPDSKVTLRVAPGDGRVEICVDDEGPGVAPELREKLFAPFFSTKSEGPGGLGLSITSRIASEAGGTLRVEDAPTGGARFRLSLPIRKA